MVYSNELANLISSLLRIDPSKRPTAEELLNNPLVQKRYNNEIRSNE
jgi:serine/threonine protein kinase